MPMMKRFIVCLMLVAGAFLTVPVDMIHLLASHSDTVDGCCTVGGTAIGEEHHHCDILQCSIPPGTRTGCGMQFLPAALPVERLSDAFAFTSVPFQAPFSIRGPPASCFS